jgi:hypothetical protein
MTTRRLIAMVALAVLVTMGTTGCMCTSPCMPAPIRSAERLPHP